MSENSRSRVTITLGRSGQVVKRDGTTVGSSTNLSPMVGSKRSARERLGNDAADSSASIGNKRQRGDDGFAVNRFNDTRLGKNDLRYKILRKSQQRKVDLRNILSRPAQSSVDSVSTRQRMPHANNTRKHSHLELKRPQSRAEETSVGGHFPPLTRNSTQQPISGFRSQHASDIGKQHALKTREGDRTPLEAQDVIWRVHKDSVSRMGDLPPMRISSIASAYSPWNLDHLRQRSPGESLVASRAISASQRDGEFQTKFPVKTYDDGSRTMSYVDRDTFEFSRPAGLSHLTKMAPPAGPVKSAAGPVVAPHHRETLPPRSSYAVDDRQTVDSFLRSLGLEKYAILLKAEEVDMFSLKRMAERDLKELGIPMGPRKKILLALQPNLKQQA